MEPSTNVDGDTPSPLPAQRGPLLQWSRRRTSTETAGARVEALVTELASMEPSTNVDGDRSTGWPQLSPSLLQWSRRRTSTETFIAIDCVRTRLVASMEPSTNVDGDPASPREGSDVSGASMEPSTNVDGDVDERDLAEHVLALQWSRRRTSTETSGRMMCSSVPFTLQWSRRRTSTETVACLAAVDLATLASMEPSTNVDGDAARRRTLRTRPRRFNGAVDERRRRHRSRAASSSARGCFNGAVDERRRRLQAAAGHPGRPDHASMEPSTNVDGDIASRY